MEKQGYRKLQIIAQTVEIPASNYDVVYGNYKDKAINGKSVELNPYEAVILKIK